MCVGGYSADSHAGDGSLLDLLVDVGGPESLDGAAVDLLHVGLVVKPYGWHVFCAQQRRGIRVSRTKQLHRDHIRVPHKLSHTVGSISLPASYHLNPQLHWGSPCLTL